MDRFLKTVSASLGKRIEQEFKRVDVWQSSFSDVRVKLNECMKIAKTWKDRTNELTREIWRGSEHKWKAKGFSDNYIDSLMARMNEIFELRSQHDELLRLLTPEDQQRLNVDQTFEPFRKINAFQSSEYFQHQWLKAKNEYERILEPMEKEIVNKLKNEIFAEKTQTPTQQLREFQRWKGLVSKDSIKTLLKSERESLLQQLMSDLRKIKEDFEGRTGQSLEQQIPGMDRPPQTQNASEQISAIVWAR